MANFTARKETRYCLVSCTGLWLLLSMILMLAVFLPLRIANNDLVITICRSSVGYRQRLCNTDGFVSMCYDVYKSLAAVERCASIRIFLTTKEKFIAEQYVEKNPSQQIHCYYDQSNPCYPQLEKNDDFTPLVTGLVFIGIFFMLLVSSILYYAFSPSEYVAID